MKPEFEDYQDLSQDNDQQQPTGYPSFDPPFAEPPHEVDEWTKDSQALGGRRYND